MSEVWYVLEDGSVADPNECAPDDKGVLRHKGGKAVAARGDAHTSRSVDPRAERAKAREDVKPEEPKAGYKTRELKAD